LQKLDIDITGEEAHWIKYRTWFCKRKNKKKKRKEEDPKG